MPVPVADVRANPNETIRRAADVIGRSKARRTVFEEIYRGKKAVKTVDDLIAATKLSRVRVLQEAGKLAANKIVEKVKSDGRLAYEKDPFYSEHKRKVLDLVDHPEKKARYPTMQEPLVSGAVTTYKITVARSLPLPTEITVDEIEAFAQVRNTPGAAAAPKLSDVEEDKIKDFLKQVIGETFDFKDWGGEKNDLFTNKVLFKGRRRSAAFAIKGKATKGVLTPKKMGSNGDQVGRLSTSPAEMFFVVYHSKVDQSIHEQLRVYGIARALAGNRVYYCVINGDDLGRLVAAYPREFEAAMG